MFLEVSRAILTSIKNMVHRALNLHLVPCLQSKEGSCVGIFLHKRQAQYVHVEDPPAVSLLK